MDNSHHKHPRLYIDMALSEGAKIDLTKDQAHYVITVMRRKAGDPLRLFNGRDGEWLGRIESAKKNSCTLSIGTLLRAQEQTSKKVHLYFPPLAKARMDIAIEKGVELGATDFHPILTQNTEIRKIKRERIESQIIEAAEQCECMSLPRLHPMEKLIPLLNDISDEPIYACLERYDAQPLQQALSASNDIRILIGPPGGFTQEERDSLIQNKAITAVSLGESVLRTETAILHALSIIRAM